ncbi:MAG: GNAT family N-acetyltransferase [Candidatus Methanofastidiosia archaeon]|jgi:ribosomal protein S18 acetylase RimI-like enzyme
MVTITPLTPKDYHTLIDLWEKSGLPSKSRGRDSKEAITHQMKENPDLFLGAFHNTNLIGSVIATFDGRKGWINRLVVDPQYRKKGIATQLIKAAETALKQKGAAVIGVLVYNDNEPSLQLFKKMGYTTDKDICYLSKRESKES